MKISSRKHDESGAAILATSACVIIITTIMFLGYFWLLMGQSKAVERSQSWNRSMTLAEAGMEEALAQINWGPNPGFGDFSANGWTQHSGTNPLVSSYGPPAERVLLDGSYYSSFIATPAGGVGATATFYSTGFVTAPISRKLISRKIVVTAAMAPLFPYAIDTKNGITLHGNSAVTGSWNSNDPKLSTNGQFWPGHTGSNAPVAIESGTADIKNDTVDGNLYLGANVSNTNNISTSWATGSIFTDYNVQIPDVTLPAGALWQIAVPTNVVTSNVSTNKKGVVTTTYTTNQMFDFTQNGYYQIPAADGSIPIQIEAGVTATMDIKATSFSPGSVNILGGQNNSGNAVFYQESGSLSLGGVPGGYRPANFIYYGLPNVTQVTISGNNTFVGVIYAPEASMTINGTPATIEGSVTVGTLTKNGNATVWYDTSLGTTAQRGFVINSWHEF